MINLLKYFISKYISSFSLISTTSLPPFAAGLDILTELMTLFDDFLVVIIVIVLLQMVLESSEDGGDMDNQSKLESCLVQVDSHLDQSYEYFKFPSDLFSQLSLVVDTSEDGIVISGKKN